MPDVPDVARGRRRGTAWVRVTRGLHRRAGVADPWRTELRAWQLLLPAEAAYSALTAAALRGWDLPPLPGQLPVCAAMSYGVTAPVRSGALRTTRHRMPPPHDVRAGLRVTTAAETLLTCAPLLSLLDLVVLVDSALRVRDIELLELRLVCRQHRRGVGRLRQAVALADPEADSVMETLLRVLYVVCGLDVETQRTVRDADGTFVARGDVWLRGTRTLADYDGAVHADRPSSARTDGVTVGSRGRTGSCSRTPTTTFSGGRSPSCVRGTTPWDDPTSRGGSGRGRPCSASRAGRLPGAPPSLDATPRPDARRDPERWVASSRPENCGRGTCSAGADRRTAAVLPTGSGHGCRRTTAPPVREDLRGRRRAASYAGVTRP